MSGEIRLHITALTDNIANQLGIYARETKEKIDERSLIIAKKAIKMLEEKSPKKTGEYAKSWRISKDQGKIVIYNKCGSLTHLLEKGHAKRGGGRVSEKVHIRPVSDWIYDEVTKQVKEILEG